VTTEVQVQEEAIVNLKKSDFLANNRNKEQFFQLLTDKLSEANVLCKNTVADADTLIVETAIERASSGEKVIIVGEDVDLLVLLVARTPSSCSSVLFMESGKGNTATRVYDDIHHIPENIPNIKNRILLAHSVSGCDTTSAVYRKGKLASYRIFEKKQLDEIVNIFNDPESDQEIIFEAGC